MRNVLLYLDPHPIRNRYDEFYFPVPLLIPSLHLGCRTSGLAYRVFSNRHVLGRLVREYPHIADHVLRPTESEEHYFAGQLCHWNEAAVARRMDLVDGRSEIAGRYIEMIARLRTEFPFDAILLWSENGAVRRFAQEAGNGQVAVLHCELGPTRQPFRESVYFDVAGTNGNAAVVSAPLDLLDDDNVVPAETWAALSDGIRPSDNVLGPRQAARIVNDHVKDLELPKRFVYVALQLADDLNTLSHSPFTDPEHFLRSVLPPLIDQGLNVVIKGHPAAAERTYNLMHEARGLRYARSFGDRVMMLDRATSAQASLFAIGQADYVCCINSSVGYEALLLGRQVITLGKAVYDIGGKLHRSVEALGDLPEVVVDDAHRRRLATFLGRHYLHPRGLIQWGGALTEGIRFAWQHRSADSRSRDFWRAWTNTFDFCAPFAVGATRTPTIKRRAPDDAPAGRWQCYVDAISDIRLDELEGVQIEGWALDAAAETLPENISVWMDEGFVPSNWTSVERPDVARIYGLKDEGSPCGFRITVPHWNSRDVAKCRLVIEIGSSAAHIVQLGREPAAALKEDPIAVAGARIAELEERSRIAEAEVASARESLQEMAQLQVMRDSAAAAAAQHMRALEQRDRDIARLTMECREARHHGHELAAELQVVRSSWLFKLSQGVLAARRRVNAARRRLRVGRIDPLFAPQWYLDKYPDVAHAGIDPFRHYMLFGAAEGRDPHPLFDTSWYLESYPDVAGSGLNPLVHFVRHGAIELRSPHPLFDCRWYAEHYPEARAEDRTPLEHYLTDGAARGFAPHPLFDTSWYLACNADVADSGTNPLVHFVEFGARELRGPHSQFDCRWYVETYPDILQAGVNPLEHYLSSGANEGRDPSPAFDTDWYRATYPEIGCANPLVHYVLVGAAKGLKPRPDVAPPGPDCLAAAPDRP